MNGLAIPARLVVHCAAVAVLLLASGARADGERDAQRHFERGVQLYQEHAYDAALTEFQTAYEAAPRFEVLFNIAQVHYQLNEYAAALRGFERYLAQGAYDIPDERRAYVLRELAVLRERVATLAVVTDVPGATVLLDFEEVGTTPLEALQVDLGRHVLRVELAGYQPVTRKVELSSGEVERVSLDLEPFAGGARAGADASSEPGRGRRAALWTLGSVGVALAAGASTSFALAFRADRDLEAQLKELPADRPAIERQRQRVERAARASDVLAASAGAAALGLVITLLVKREPRTTLDVGAGTLGVRRRF
jgi:tetratricopeptide (TPR) repeat protein